MSDAAALLAAARQRLEDAGTPREALGRWRTPGRILHRAPRIERVGSAWRLGALLLPGDDGRSAEPGAHPAVVLAVGDVVRAEPEVRRGYAAESARERAARRAAAARGGFRPGEVVHVGWQPIDLDAVAAGEASGPLRLSDGRPMIRWSAAGALMPLDAYLRERVALLLDPPERA